MNGSDGPWTAGSGRQDGSDDRNRLQAQAGKEHWLPQNESYLPF